MKYTACTMSKDEEHNVEKWLERTKDFDYRVVVDTGSTDDTVKLLKNSDVLLDICEFDDFRFDVARNCVASRVPKDADWLFWPDMDEEYEPGWREHMEDIIKETPKVTRVLHKSIHYKNGVCEGGRESGTGIDSKIFKRGYYKWIKPIHEYPVYHFPSKEEVVVTTDKIVRHHYHYDRQWVDDLCYDIAKRAVEDDPEDSWCIWFALRDAYYRQLVDDTLKYGELYLDVTKPYTDFRSLAHMFIGLALVRKYGKVTEEVKISMLRAVAENPGNKKAWDYYRIACDGEK